MQVLIRNDKVYHIFFFDKFILLKRVKDLPRFKGMIVFSSIALASVPGLMMSSLVRTPMVRFPVEERNNTLNINVSDYISVPLLPTV